MRALHRLLAGALAALGLACAEPALATIVFNSNSAATSFDATTSGMTPTGWTYPTGTWQVSTSVPHVSSHTNGFGDTSQTNNAIAVYSGGTATADSDATMTQYVTLSSGKATTNGIGVRYNSAGNTGYVCIVSIASAGSVTIQIYRQNSGTFTGFTGSGIATGAFTVSGSAAISMRFSVTGTALACKAWNATGVEPTTFQTTATDSTVTGTGYLALSNGQTVVGQQGGVTDLVLNDTPKGEANAIAVTTPPPLAIGATVSGSYTGTVPTGLGISFDGATTFTAISGPTISGGAFSFALPTAAAGYHQMTIQATNATSEVSATPAFSSTGSSSTLAIAPNNSAFLYSPYNWTPATSAVASTINPGAYLKILFTGSTLALNFNTTNNSSPFSEIYYRIDGYEQLSPWTESAVASSITVTVPTTLVAGNGNTYHLLELMVKSTSETINRWNSPSNTAVNFTGLQIATGASVALPMSYSKKCLLFGDSRMEGVRTINQTATNDTDRNDALTAWPWQVGTRLGCEYGIVGFGGQGVTITGSGNVVPLPSSYNLIMAGVSRSFTPNPDLIAIMDVGNDYNNSVSTSAVQTAMTNVLNSLLAATTTSKIAVLQDFIAAAYAPQLQAAVTAVGSSRVTYVPTPSFFNTAYGADSLGLHPTAANDIGLIAPQLASALSPILYPVGGSGTLSIGGSGIHVP